jgi:hypothetical protein
MGKHCRKIKIMRGNIVTFQYFKEKNYEAKLTKIILKKKSSRETL